MHGVAPPASSKRSIQRASGEIDVPITKHTITTLEYKGFRIEVTSVGKGWRASIFEMGSNRALPDSPLNLESRSEEIVAEARRIIDARLAA